jgi:hypothetical protein
MLLSPTPDLLDAKKQLKERYLRESTAAVVGRVYELGVSAARQNASNNVHAIGIGRKTVAGKTESVEVIRVHVVQKLPQSLVPIADRIPSEIDGIPTDIVESPVAFLRPSSLSLIRSHQTPNPYAIQRLRPLRAGLSTSHPLITAGTIGYFCRSVRPGDDPTATYLLSNNHVFANVNQATSDDAIFQPGVADGGTNTDTVATLERWMPIQLNSPVFNKVDAAIARLVPGVGFLPSLPFIGSVNGPAVASEELLVCKFGRTSGYTEGYITDVAYDATVGMDHSDPTIFAKFENQIRIEARLPRYAFFGLGGDSGSLVVSKTDKKAVGLYFAGPDSGIYGIANPIEQVLSELEIELL